MNSYNKIQQIIAINMNKNILMKKMYAVSVISSKISDKKTHSSSFHVITSHIMSLNESENKLF